MLKSLATGIENRRRQSLGRSKKLSVEFGCVEAASNWEMQVDVDGWLVVPQEIVCSRLRPDIVLWSVSQQRVDFIDLTV